MSEEKGNTSDSWRQYKRISLVDFCSILIIYDFWTSTLFNRRYSCSEDNSIVSISLHTVFYLYFISYRFDIYAISVRSHYDCSMCEMKEREKKQQQCIYTMLCQKLKCTHTHMHIAHIVISDRTFSFFVRCEQQVHGEKKSCDYNRKIPIVLLYTFSVELCLCDVCDMLSIRNRNRKHGKARNITSINRSTRNQTKKLCPILLSLIGHFHWTITKTREKKTHIWPTEPSTHLLIAEDWWTVADLAFSFILDSICFH